MATNTAGGYIFNYTTSGPCLQCGKPHGYNEHLQELRGTKVVNVSWFCSRTCADAFDIERNDRLSHNVSPTLETWASDR